MEAATTQIPAAPQQPGGPAPEAGDRERRPRRKWLQWVKWLALIVALPVAALLIGILIAWIVHQIRGNSTPKLIVPVTQPSAGAPRVVESAPAKAAPVVVPSDWVAEVAPPAGLTFSHPVGWIRRTSTPEVLRFEPASPGSTAPGIDGVGAGIEPVASPAQALTDFATRVYGAQPGFTPSAVTAVSATAPGAHPGEQQEVVSYLRSGVEVEVVLHSFRSGTQTVLVLGRSGRADAALAAQLEAYAEASLQVG